ncbi:DUF5050 domain-containing protein [Longibacter salinarum]|nr:DUF5050 domain-containing protein [Longibacter salinarum]
MHTSTTRLWGFLFSFFLLFASVDVQPSVAQDQLYWSASGSGTGVYTADLDGNSEQKILGRLRAPIDVAVHEQNGDVYYTDTADNAIYRVTGSGAPASIVATDAPVGIDVDEAGGHIYWTTRNSTNGIYRADLNGGNVTLITDGLVNPEGLAVDPANDHIYWLSGVRSSSTVTAVRRVDFDGSNATTLVNNPGANVYRIVLDVPNNKMYWTTRQDNTASSVQGANLDGSNVQNVVTGSIEAPQGLALDADDGTLYWSETALSGRGLYSAATDGSNVTQITQTRGVISGLAVDPTDDSILSSDFLRDVVERRNASGTLLDVLDQAPLASYGAFTIDADGLLYFTDDVRGEIVRFGPDGTGRVVIVSGETSPVDVTYDKSTDNLYWIDSASSGTWTVRRSSRFGQSPQTILSKTGNGEMADIAIDESSGRVYVTDPEAGELIGMDDDGSNVSTILSGIDPGPGLAVRSTDGAILWTNTATSTIDAVNPDGSGATTVISDTEAENPEDVSAPPFGNLLYWTTATDKLKQSNLDGSNVSTVSTPGAAPVAVLRGPQNPLPVTLVGFDVRTSRDRAILEWTTASEVNNAGFGIERSADGTSFEHIGFVNGAGTTEQAQSYRFADEDVPTGTTLHYRLRQTDVDGTTWLSPVQTVMLETVDTRIHALSPHPVRSQTTFSFETPVAGPLTLEVFDLLGRRVTKLAHGRYAAGTHTATIQPDGWASGTYILRLSSPSDVVTQRFTVVR